ncbi:hypothetical protein ACIQF6_08040 [Kitasatospora sp. NPDC092948]|uniref:hypothetical protein n=1 Tax=Kitasatospora sp. NPDC092948 TaxID=3364088 RepID=UPI003805D059
MTFPTVPTDPVTGLPTGTVVVFLTLCSAPVALYPSGTVLETGQPTYMWTCLGCGEHTYYPEQRGTVRHMERRRRRALRRGRRADGRPRARLRRRRDHGHPG